jgi:hypothetical protein
MFETYDQKLIIFTFYGRFHEVLPTLLGFHRICMARKTRYMFERFNQKHFIFSFYGRFHELLSLVLGFQGNLHV